MSGSHVDQLPRGLAEATERTRARYDRIAPVYDLLDGLMELRFRHWRQELWSEVPSGPVLELGIGTGKNMRHYPNDVTVTGVDISPKMIDRSRGRAEKLGLSIDLHTADVQCLPFDDGAFPVAVGTFLFCSVPDPLRGLCEVRRVLAPGGQLFLLEHVISKRPVLARLMSWLDPLSVRLWGAHIDRNTRADVERADFEKTRCEFKWLDVVERITARAPA